MTQITVSMTLERYKQLEEAEQSLYKILSDPTKYVTIKVSYGISYMYPMEMHEALEKMRKDIATANEYAEHWRKEAERKKRTSWF